MNDNFPATQSGSLALYETACHALSVAKSTDEVKDIRDKAEAMRAYAHQAKNRQMEIDAAEIRIRAERRLGELIQAQKETVGLARGGQPYQSRPTGSDMEPVENPAPTLAEIGIDKKLSSHAQKVAAIPDDEFESIVGDWRETLETANDRVTTNLLKAASKSAMSPPPEPKPATSQDSEVEALRAEIEELRAQLAELAAQCEETLAENMSMSEVLEADDRVTAALEEAKKYRELYRIEKERSNSLINEKDAAIRAAKSWQRKAGAA